jgi:hypothetical protein
VWQILALRDEKAQMLASDLGDETNLAPEWPEGANALHFIEDLHART